MHLPLPPILRRPSHDKDRDFTRFLWLEDLANPNNQFTSYRIKSVLFVAFCSPSMLNAALLEHLQLNKNIAESNIIERDLYVDNVISSFGRESDALQYYQDARNLLSSAEMSLRSWSSTNGGLREHPRREGVLDTEPINKVLGLRWEPATDTLSFFCSTGFSYTNGCQKETDSEILTSDLRYPWITQPCYDSRKTAPPRFMETEI